MGCRRWCRSCCSQFIRFWLLVLNLADGLAGITLLAWGGYLRAQLEPDDNSSEGYWAALSALALGALLFLSAALSFLGAVSKPCRCGLCLSAWLSIPIAFAELLAGIVGLARKADLFDYLREHRDTLRISSHVVDTLENFDQFVIAALFALSAAEAVRAVLSTTLRRHINLNIAEYDAILRETEASEARSDLEARLIVKEKYDHLRESYRAKYSRDDGHDSEGAEMT